MHPPAPVAPPSVSEPPVLARVGTAAWRLLVAACAFWGVYLVAYQPMLGWTDLWFLSQSGSLIAAICYAVMAPIPLIPGSSRIEPGLAWLRGALASMMLLICIASIFILGGGDLDQTGFLFEHLITPLVVAADLVLVGRAQLRAKAWHPLTWIAIPLGYLILANLAGEAAQLYGGILEPSNPEFLMYVGMFLVTAIVFGYILFGLVKLRGLIGSAAQPHATQPPMWNNQFQQPPGAPYGPGRQAFPQGPGQQPVPHGAGQQPVPQGQYGAPPQAPPPPAGGHPPPPRS